MSAAGAQGSVRCCNARRQRLRSIQPQTPLSDYLPPFTIMRSVGHALSRTWEGICEIGQHAVVDRTDVCWTAQACQVGRAAQATARFFRERVRWEGNMTQSPEKDSASHSPGAAIDRLHDEYEQQRSIFNAQPLIVQRFLEAQARQIAEAYVERARGLRFTLPDRVVTKAEGRSEPARVVEGQRQQFLGGLRDRLEGKDVHLLLRQRLAELDQSSDEAVAVSSGLIRFSVATHMVDNMLPSGRSVSYAAAEGEDTPSIPVSDGMEPESAITASTDAIAEEGKVDEGRGDLLVPYVPAARRFYLPQWVPFDEHDRLLVNSVSEAEADIKSMQSFLNVLFAARSLAPYIIADAEYHSKHYGMLGQLINQGRALARYMTGDIIRTVKARAKAQSLNRGLSLRLPYFDDQELAIRTHGFVVIPAGRIMFVPAFVVRAAREEQAKVTQDTRFSASTRKHLLVELQMLEEAFKASGA